MLNYLKLISKAQCLSLTFVDRKPTADPIANIMEEMRASPASTSPVSAQTQQERTAAARRAEERAAEQERRRREAVSIFLTHFLAQKPQKL